MSVKFADIVDKVRELDIESKEHLLELIKKIAHRREKKTN